MERALVYITSKNRDLIFNAIRVMYTDIAQDPARGYHVPTGSAACKLVGYPTEQLARLPTSAVESFAGVGYPFVANVIRASDTVLDIGSGGHRRAAGRAGCWAISARYWSGSHHGHARKAAGKRCCRGRVERVRTGRKRRAHPSPRCFSRCGHE